MKLNFNFNKRNKYKNICSIEGYNNSACGLLIIGLWLLILIILI